MSFPGSYPEASQATTALVLGIVGLLMCGIVSPVAWVIGHKEVAAIDSRRRPPENRSAANAGRILGIIGSLLLGLFVLGTLAWIVLALFLGFLGSASVPR